MAKKELIRFWSEYLPGHPDVRADLGAIADDHQFATALIEAGAKAGFDFGESDVQDVMGARQSPAIGELSDAQLEAVSGGRGGDTPVKYMEYKMKEVLISGV
jgi:hypothetical protein